MDQANAAANPTQSRGERDLVGAQCIGGRFKAWREFHRSDHGLDVRQRARKPRRQMIRQQTEGRMTWSAIPARNARSRRVHPLVGTVAGEPTVHVEMKRAARQTCGPPQLQGNVVLAGVPRLETKLHRQPARVGAYLRGPSSYDGDRREDYRLLAPRETQPGAVADRAWIACGRPQDRVDNANHRVAHTRPQPIHPRPEYRSRNPCPALRAWARFACLNHSLRPSPNQTGARIAPPQLAYLRWRNVPPIRRWIAI